MSKINLALSAADLQPPTTSNMEFSMKNQQLQTVNQYHDILQRTPS